MRLRQAMAKPINKPSMRQGYDGFCKSSTHPTDLHAPSDPVAVLGFLRKALDRHHPLAFGGGEHDHALRRAAGDADAVDRAADELAAIGDQHALVLLLERKGSNQRPVL